MFDLHCTGQQRSDQSLRDHGPGHLGKPRDVRTGHEVVSQPALFFRTSSGTRRMQAFMRSSYGLPIVAVDPAPCGLSEG